jgi:DNA binding domain, excisionase family
MTQVIFELDAETKESILNIEKYLKVLVEGQKDDEPVGIKEAAQMLGIGYSTTYKMVRSKELKSIAMIQGKNTVYKIERDEIEAFKERRVV